MKRWTHKELPTPFGLYEAIRTKDCKTGISLNGIGRSFALPIHAPESSNGI